MANNKIDLVNGSLPKNIIKFTLPIFAMGVMQILFVACDMLVLGIFAHSKSLAAVGATTYVVNLFVNTFIGISVGVNVVAAQFIGAKDNEKVSKIVHTSITASALFGLILMLLGTIFNNYLLKIMNTPSDIINSSTLYLRIYFFSTPANLIFNFGAAILRASGDSKSPFKFITAAGLINMALNVFLVTVIKLDVAGVAIGTFVSQVIAASLVLRRLMKDESNIKFYVRKIGINISILKDILRIGIPTGINNMVFSIANAQIQSAVNTFGSSAIAGTSSSHILESFVYKGTNSLMQATISFVGQNVGAKRIDNVPRIVKWSLIYSCLIAVALGGFSCLAGRPIFTILLKDAKAVDYAMIRTLVIMIPYMLCGIMEVFAGTMRGLGYSVLPTIITLAFACGLRVIWVNTVFSWYPIYYVLFFVYPISWLLTSISHFISYVVVTRTKLKPKYL